MPFDKAEARLKTIKKLQAQLKEYETECYPRKGKKTYTIDAHSSDKAMKDLMRLSEENIWMRKEIKAYEKNALNSGEMLLKQNEEIKRLKEQNKMLLQDWEDMTEEANNLDKENKKLKQKYELSLEQTDKLEEENKNLNKYLAETKIHLCFEEDMKKLKEGFEEMTQDQIIMSHEWVEWKEYSQKCQRWIKRNKSEEICCECKREKKSPGDMFVTDVDINRVKTVRCGECALSFYKSK